MFNTLQKMHYIYSPNVQHSVPDLDPHVFGPPDSDPLVTGMDLDPDQAPDPSIILLSSSKNSKKNLDSSCFVTYFGLCKMM
jgi:hypothetical protein